MVDGNRNHANVVSPIEGETAEYGFTGIGSEATRSNAKKRSNEATNNDDPGSSQTAADCCRWSGYIKRTVSRRFNIHRKSLNSITFVKKTLV